MKNGQCVSSCGVGYYGVATFSSRSKISQSYCATCPTGCYECSSGSASACISCKAGYYLNVGSSVKTTGTCTAKSASAYTYTLYVNDVSSQTTTDPTSITGTYTDAFNSIQDAISKAYELGAPYTSATITIILKQSGSSTHAMLRAQGTKYYMPTKYDQNAQTTAIVLTTESADSYVKVNYKMRDKYTFMVGGGLTINNIEFDAVDSSIVPAFDTNGCLLKELNCCYVQNNLLKGTTECSSAYEL